MKIFVGADHAGVQQKEYVKKILDKLQLEYEDVGSNAAKSNDDYPDFAKKVARKVLKGGFGILLCGSGSGMAIAANKIKGIRAAVCYDVYSAKMARYDNDTNILTFRSRKFPKKMYEPIIKAFFGTPFSEIPRHKRRLQKIRRMER